DPVSGSGGGDGGATADELALPRRRRGKSALLREPLELFAMRAAEAREAGDDAIGRAGARRAEPHEAAAGVTREEREAHAAGDEALEPGEHLHRVVLVVSDRQEPRGARVRHRVAVRI